MLVIVLGKFPSHHRCQDVKQSEKRQNPDTDRLPIFTTRFAHVIHKIYKISDKIIEFLLAQRARAFNAMQFTIKRIPASVIIAFNITLQLMQHIWHTDIA